MKNKLIFQLTLKQSEPFTTENLWQENLWRKYELVINFWTCDENLNLWPILHFWPSKNDWKNSSKLDHFTTYLMLKSVEIALFCKLEV